MYLDSLLIVKQMKGEWKVKARNLKGMFLDCQKKVREAGIKIRFLHTRREGNERADALANMAMDSKKDF